MKLKRRSTK
ncbi:UNVERIFIED_CONTAM: hypothetical protein GTU68_035772 [Idotea baltica]|nr:hypothetical protein [Idotea baltica]